MSLQRIGWIVGVLAIMAPSGAMADLWESPQPRIFASTWGSHGFKVLEPKFGGASLGLLFALDAQGKEKVIWQEKLVNTPHRAVIADTGKHVATIDTYGSVGKAHAVVLYDAKGKAICDLTLEDFLTKEEINKHARQSVSSRWWSEKAEFTFDHTHFVIRLNWGKVVRIALANGKVS